MLSVYVLALEVLGEAAVQRGVDIELGAGGAHAAVAHVVADVLEGEEVLGRGDRAAVVHADRRVGVRNLGESPAPDSAPFRSS